MNEDELLEYVAAHVNYYKYYRKQIDYQEIYNTMSEYFESPEQLYHFYKTEYRSELDQVFLVDSVHKVFYNDKHLYCTVEWVNFPLELNNPENFLEIREVDPDLATEYVNEHHKEFEAAVAALSDAMLSRYVLFFKDYNGLVEPMRKELQKRQSLMKDRKMVEKIVELTGTTLVDEEPQQLEQKNLHAPAGAIEMAASKPEPVFESLRSIGESTVNTAAKPEEAPLAPTTGIYIEEHNPLENILQHTNDAKAPHGDAYTQGNNIAISQETLNLLKPETRQAILDIPEDLLQTVLKSMPVPQPIEITPTFTYENVRIKLKSDPTKALEQENKVKCVTLLRDINNHFLVQFNNVRGAIIMIQELHEFEALEKAFLLAVFSEIPRMPHEKLIQKLNGEHLYECKTKIHTMKQLCDNRLILQQFNWDVCQLFLKK